MNTHITVVSLWAEDVPAAAHFYQDVVGLNNYAAPCRRSYPFRPGWLCPDDRPWATRRFRRTQSRYSRWSLFRSLNWRRRSETLRLYGVDLPWGVETNAASRWVMFHDPAGNLVELVEFNNKGGHFQPPLFTRGYLRRSARFSSTAWSSSLSSAR